MNEMYVVHLTADAENIQVAIRTSFNIHRVKYIHIYYIDIISRGMYYNMENTHNVVVVVVASLPAWKHGNNV